MIKSLDKINAISVNNKILQDLNHISRAHSPTTVTLQAVVENLNQRILANGKTLFEMIVRTLDSRQALIVVESEAPAPKGSTVTLLVNDNSIHLQVPSKADQQLALLQLNQHPLPPPKVIADGLKKLVDLQKALQNNPNLAKAEKQLLRQITSLLESQVLQRPTPSNIQ